MLIDIVRVKPLEGYKLYLEFEDGVSGTVDISQMISFTGVFACVKEDDYFQQVSVNSEIGTIVWPNGADLDPDVLYAAVTGKPVPEFIASKKII